MSASAQAATGVIQFSVWKAQRDTAEGVQGPQQADSAGSGGERDQRLAELQLLRTPPDQTKCERQSDSEGTLLIEKQLNIVDITM